MIVKNKHAWAIVAASIVAGSSIPVARGSSSANLVTNGSFESGNYTYGSHGAPEEADALPNSSTTITGWTVGSQCDVCIVASGNLASITPEDGNICLDLTGFQDALPYASITQTIPTQVGQQYALSFWLECDNNVPGNFTSYNGPVSVNASAGGASGLFTNAITTEGNQWEEFTLPFTATSTSTPIAFTGELATGGRYLGLDNVSVTAVPEPASVGILGVGIVAVLSRRRRLVK
jgi:hypothetical protein